MAEIYEFNFTEQELKMPITEVGLSSRAMKILRRTAIETLGDLVEYIQTNKLPKLYGMGETRIQDIIGRLTAMQSPEQRERQAKIIACQAHLKKIEAQERQIKEEFAENLEILHNLALIQRVKIAHLTELNRGPYGKK